jgi:amino acid adenylation domain-containing protein
MSSVRNAAERHRLLVEWNDTARDYPRHLCLHQLFEAAADRAPEAVALVNGTAEITYAELEGRANQVARHLQRLGVAPESLVGICTPRTADMIAGMLGTLKAGAAYLSLDPAYPRERLAFMLEDSAAPVVLTQERLLDGLGAAAPAGSTAFVCFDRDARALAAESAQRLPSAAGPGSLAYAIYTSGSTGRPKGVAIEHRSAAVLCHWAREVFPAADLAGMLASTSINFDLSVFEIFVPLAWGGTVILAENALALPHLPAAGRVTFVNTVPSAIAELVRAGSLPPSVRTVGLAGEPLKGVLAERIYARGVHAVYNLYGPSEDTTYSTWVRVEPGAPGEPTIGRPIAGTELYLLRPGMEVASFGDEGEVYLGGQGLARGYLNRPDLTAERFFPDPFSGRPGARLYRVGDLGRFLPNGEVQFLGRVDHQVKIRGFRIELGEIEAALSRHPAVTEAVVTARLAGSAEEGDLRLVAYVEPHPEITPDPPSLRSFLRERLPAHMVPSVFVFLDPLPRTPNGKVDRKALPEPDWTASAGREEDEATAVPRTALEELVAGLWCEALGASHVGLHDHFLELGGHSLLAARLVSRVRDTLGIQADLPALFAHPTVAGFAAELERLRGGRAEGMPALRPAPREGDLAASLMQSRLWFLDQLAPGSPFNNVAIAAHLTGPLRPEALELGLREIVRRHESLRTTFDDRGGPLLQRIAPRLDLNLPVVDLAALPPALRTAEMERLSADSAAVPFDLRRGPVLRAELLRLDAEEHRLLLVLHHNVADDWSVWVLFRELSALYRAFVAGNPHPLPDPMAVQYADFAVWQSRWLDTPGAMDDFVAHARQLLADVPTDLDLPADRPRPPLPTFRGRLHRFALPAALSPGLRTLSRREGATLFMTLLAAFEVHAARFTGRQRFLIGSPTASRSRTELEGLIGLVSNTAVWRADLTGSPDFPGLLRRVRETVLAGSRFDALPFERVPTDLKAAKKDSYSSFLQLLFVLQTVPRPEPELAPGLRVRTWEMDTGTSKVDLSLFLWDDDDGLTGAVEYSTDLFDPTTILRLVDQYRRVLEGILAAPDLRVTEIDLLSPAERWQVLGEWSDAAGGRKVLGAVGAALQPCPIGVAGDLYETGEDGLRRTGDRARFRADGRLEVFAPPGQPAAGDGPDSMQATGSTAAFGTFGVFGASGALEELIAGVWERVLGIEGIGHQQSFFALGGHSLLATQVLSRLRDLLKVEVPFRALFERPTVAGLARAIRDERRTSTLPPLEPGARDGRNGRDDRDDHPPLSFAQQRLWFLDRLDPGTAVFNLASLYSVHGPLSTAALGKTLAEIVRRHEALRTTIATSATLDREAVQLVHPPSAPELPWVDLSSLPAERRQGEGDRLVEREARRGFDPERGPLVRFLLLRSGTDDHRFLATFHHLVSDGGSLILFERELVALYGAFSAGRPSPLADPAVQYGDYAAWQRLCLTGDHLQEDLAFWRRRLAPPVPALRLPTDRPRPAVPSSRGALAQATFPSELTAAVRELSRREGSTLYITLMTAFLALLHRATGQRDITLGTPVSLRDHSRLEDVIGLFVNTLALRAEVAPGASFRELLAHVRERVLEAFTYRDLPFERLVEELQPERGAHETPFFQLMFSLQAMQEETLRTGDLELRLLDLENGTAQFELTLYMVDTGHGLVALAEYRTDLFAAATIDRMLGAYQSLLEAAVAAPEVPLAGLPVRDWLAAVPPVAVSAVASPGPAAETAEEREARLNAKRDQLSDEQKEQLRQRMQRLRRR